MVGRRSFRAFGLQSSKDYRATNSKSPAKKPYLESLPDEILYEIIGLISPEQRVPLGFQAENAFWDYEEPVDLLALLRCSRRLYQICTPFLYNTFTQSHQGSWVPFMRTILASPDLVESVHNLKLSNRRYYEASNNYADIFSKDTIELMHYHVESRTIDDQIKALSLEDEHLRTIQTVHSNVKPLPVNYDRKGLTARESLARVRGGTSDAPTSETLGKKIMNRASNFLVSREPNEPQPSTGLPTSHDAEQIVRTLVADDWKAMTTYLVYRLPNLNTLTLEEDRYDPRSADLEGIVQRALSHQSITIPYLRKLIIIYTKRTHSSKLQTYWHLLLQPSLRSFSATKIQEYGWLPSPRDLSLPLTHLSFHECNLSTSSIDAFLKCCPNLEYLYYSHVQSWGEQRFIPRLFGTSIVHLKDTLKHLTLHRPELQYGLSVMESAEVSLLEASNLKQLSRLQSLDITAHLLLGPQEARHSGWWAACVSYPCPTQKLLDALPANLEVLSLKDCGDKVESAARELARERGEKVPRLRKIYAEYISTESVENIRRAEEIVDGYFVIEETVNGVRIRGSRRIDDD